MTFSRKFLIVPALVSLFACSTANQRSQSTRNPASGATNEVCAKVHPGKSADGEPVIFCDQTFSEAPFVRPEADDVTNPTAVKLHMGLREMADAVDGITTWIDREGNEYAWVDAKGKPLNITAKKSLFPASVKMPSHRNLYFVYTVVGKITHQPVTKTNPFNLQIQVASVTPEILITGCAMDSLFLGTWEGTVTRKLVHPYGPIVYDSSTVAPIQVEFTSLSKTTTAFNENEGGGDLPKLADGQYYTLQGQIKNWNDSATSAETTHAIASIASYHELGPFPGNDKSQPDVSINRMAAMHTGLDEVAVFGFPTNHGVLSPGLPGSGMDGEQKVMIPYALIQKNPANTYRELSIIPHAPPSGFNMKLHWVSIGAHAGECAK